MSSVRDSFRKWAVSNERDLGGRWWAIGAWGVGAALVLAGFFIPECPRVIAWTFAFGSSGTLCLVNAVRSGRFHCMYTGPIFLLGAVLTVLRAVRVIGFAWNTIGLGVAAGILVALAIERLLGKSGQGCC